jgi:hypothetical protein
MADSTKVWAATIPQDGAAVFAAPKGTALPTDATADLDAAFVDLGWVSEDGVMNSIRREVTRHKAWGGDTVKTTQDNYEESFKLALLETTAAVLGVIYGEDNVVETADTLSVMHSSLMLKRQSFVIEFIDGDSTGRIVIEDGLVVELEDVQYSHKELLSYGITVDVYKPADGSAAVKQYYSLGTGTAVVPNPAIAPKSDATVVSKTAAGTKTSEV